jgi:hypothetical protein
MEKRREIPHSADFVWNDKRKIPARRLTGMKVNGNGNKWCRATALGVGERHVRSPYGLG